MKTKGMPRSPRTSSAAADRTTFGPGDYGRVLWTDGTERWWIRSSNGAWTALTHQRVIENGDGTITLLYVSEESER